MKLTSATIIRDAEKGVDYSYLQRVVAAFTGGFGVAAPSNSRKTIKVIRQIEPVSVERFLSFHNNEISRDRPIGFYFGGGKVTSTDDISPFPILFDADGKTTMVAFLDGDFSEFDNTETVHSAAYNCVQKKIIPLVNKAKKTAGDDLGAIISELSDDLWSDTWGNLMVGSEGSITLMAANGDVKTFLVRGETSAADIDGGWTSNNIDLQPAEVEEPLPAPAEVREPSDDPFEDIPHTPGEYPEKEVPAEAKPVQQKNNKNKNTAPPPPAKGSVAPLSTLANTAKEAAKDGHTKVVDEVAALMNPNTMLRLNIPKTLNLKQKHKWMKKRTPLGFVWPGNLSTVHYIECNRAGANPAFLGDYMKQEGITSMDMLKMHTAASAQVAVQQTPAATSVPASGNAGKQPEKPVTTQAAAAPAIPAKPTLGLPDKKVTDEPMVMFSPEQRQQLVAMVQSSEFKQAFDKHGKVITLPNGLEQLDKQVKELSDQFGGVTNIHQIAQWPYDQFLKFAQNDKGLTGVAKLAFCLAIELLKANAMIVAMDPKKAKNVHEEPMRVLKEKEPEAKVLNQAIGRTNRAAAPPPPPRKTA